MSSLPGRAQYRHKEGQLRVQMRWPPELVRMIDQLAAAQEPPLSRNAMVIELLSMLVNDLQRTGSYFFRKRELRREKWQQPWRCVGCLMQQPPEKTPAGYGLGINHRIGPLCDACM